MRGEWRWFGLRTERITIDRWAEGQPNENEDCIEILHGVGERHHNPDFWWNDLPCEYSTDNVNGKFVDIGFFCEKLSDTSP